MNEFSYSNANELAIKFTLDAKYRVPEKLRDLAKDTGQYIHYAAVGHLANHTRTGNLAGNIHVGPVERLTPDTYRVNVGVGLLAPYARYVEEGTGLYFKGHPHYIHPKTASVMSWVEKGSFATAYQGSNIYSKKIGKGKFRVVAHKTKGQKPVHFMENAFDDARTKYIPLRLSQLGGKII